VSEKIYLDWNNDSLWWVGGPSGPPGSVDYIWSEVYIVIEVANTLAAGGYLQEDHQWDWLEKKLPPKVSEEFKKIVIKVNDLSKERNDDIKITVDHIIKTFTHYGVKVDVKWKESSSAHVEMNDEKNYNINKSHIDVSLGSEPKNIRIKNTE